MEVKKLLIGVIYGMMMTACMFMGVLALVSTILMVKCVSKVSIGTISITLVEPVVVMSMSVV